MQHSFSPDLLLLQKKCVRCVPIHVWRFTIDFNAAIVSQIPQYTNQRMLQVNQCKLQVFQTQFFYLFNLRQSTHTDALANLAGSQHPLEISPTIHQVQASIKHIKT